MKTRWGECRLRAKRWQCSGCGTSESQRGQGIDQSELSLKSLAIVLDLATRLPYREAVAALKLQSIEISVSQVERLMSRYGERVVEEMEERLTEKALEALGSGGGEVKIVEVDGVSVLEVNKPEKGKCKGREVKQGVIFGLSEPSKRCYVAKACKADEFSGLMHGLIRQAGVKQQDKLIGVADGAPWIDQLFDEMGVDVRVLDVFHAVQYLDTLMKVMG